MSGSLSDLQGGIAPGLIAPGTINLHQRPKVRNPDGSISTVRSITITDPMGRAVLIPTVVGDQVVSNEDAIKHYKLTGQHLGIFKDETSADNYAQTLHEQQAKEYTNQNINPFIEMLMKARGY